MLIILALGSPIESITRKDPIGFSFEHLDPHKKVVKITYLILFLI